MRNIYLIRHGRVNYHHRCIGRVDLPLDESAYGELKAKFAELPKQECTVFTSPLKRARQTAAYYFLEENQYVLPDFIEIDVGMWENRPFDQIRQLWPDVYEKRGENPYETRLPGGESYQDVAKRCITCLKELIKNSNRDLIIVTHSGCIQSMLCELGYMDKSEILKNKVAYGSVTKLQMVDDPELLKIYDEWKVPDHIRAHMVEVAVYADEIAECLEKAGMMINRKKLRQAALLHDIARMKKHHPEVAADYLRKKGYEDLADLIALHHDLGMQDEREIKTINEALILYYADKRIQGARKVSLEDRFAKSAERCVSDAAKAAFEKRYAIACEVHKELAQYGIE